MYLEQVFYSLTDWEHRRTAAVPERASAENAEEALLNLNAVWKFPGIISLFVIAPNLVNIVCSSHVGDCLLSQSSDWEVGPQLGWRCGFESLNTHIANSRRAERYDSIINGPRCKHRALKTAKCMKMAETWVTVLLRSAVTLPSSVCTHLKCPLVWGRRDYPPCTSPFCVRAADPISGHSPHRVWE